MSDQNPISNPPPRHISRPVGSTELSWCKAVPTGTGITVLALLFSKPPNLQNLQTTLHNLRISHPILLSTLQHSAAISASTSTFSFLVPTSPTRHFEITTVDLSSTSLLLQSLSAVTPFHALLEHELNQSSWFNPNHPSYKDAAVMFATVYTLNDLKWVVSLRLHTAACDRTSAVTLLRETMRLIGEGMVENRTEGLGDVKMGIESYVPKAKCNKPFWARGVDVIGYSLNSLRLSSFSFADAGSTRGSNVVRLKMSSLETDQVLNGCKSRGIKLCAVIAAAALIATRSSKGHHSVKQWEKYAVVTLIDCRSMLDPPLSSHDFGFYHSAILNTHSIKGGEELWDLAKRTHTAFTDAKNRDKHFWDMGDISFLMCKAIENPNLTPSSSLRTSLITVFEDPVIDHSDEKHREIGLEDYIGCSSVHGVGPSIAVFDTIRDGQLDCACVYPSPLHSREQMEQLVDGMKRIIIDGCTFVETNVNAL